MKIIQALITIQAVNGFHLIPTSPSFRATNLQTSVKRDIFSPFTTNASSRSNKNLILTNHLSSVSDDEGEKDKMAKKVKGRKKRVIGGYKIITFSYFLTGCVVAATSRVPYFGTGAILTAGLAYVLRDAAVNDRLTSDTYKRLNLALGTSALLSTVGTVLMQGATIQLLLGFIAVVNSIKGYGYGLKGWELKSACAKEDFANGFKTSLATMAKVPNLNSLAYLAATLTTTSLTAIKISEVIELILGNSKKFLIGSRVYRVSKLLLMSTICFTLKDAADRDRLKGTTFIELNYMISFTFATMAGT
jgi:hypothetical protein